MGRALDPNFVMSEEELLLGQVSLPQLGLNNVWAMTSPRTGSSRTGRSLLSPLFWAGLHNSPLKLRFLSLSEEKKRGFDVSERMEVRRAWGARAGSYFGRATIYEARPFTPGGFMSPSSNGEAWIERPSFFLEFLGRSDLFSLLPAI